ncbi:MAG: N-acetylmuramoyl-L-alanine amidase, partial [Candidatus Krumholzibacteria bacterium]|nr:N-acetylmuramoyl-L-alanine amidase [Candidatus Krumholzibacteria bacterium]
MRILSFMLFPAALAALLLAGCAGRPPAYERLYERLTEDLAAPDPGVLAGRRIVIDPGHGGAFDGAVGADSLTEAEINLGVALHLWGLLREAGADVQLTRTTDRDFLPDSTADVTGDLAARVERANAFSPDVFLSIHHNASPGHDRGRNAVELYYRADDPLASLELAVDLHTHLARNLGIGETGIRPGTYFVLRRSTAAAAVLGEASYLSHPAVEERLKLAAKQRLEAEAYFLGLAAYFSRGVPLIERIAPGSDTMAAPGTIVCRITPAAGVPVDPASIGASVGSRSLAPVLLPGGMASFDLPLDLANGPHQVSIRASSVAGATAVLGPLRIAVDRPAAFILPLPERFPRPGEPREARLLVLDEEGRAVADGAPVVAEGPGKSRLTALTSGGIARLPIPAGSEGSWTFTAGGAAAGVSIVRAPAAGAGASIRPVDARTGAAIEGAGAVLEGGRHVGAGADGLIRLSPSDTSLAFVKAPGYRYLFPGASSAIPDSVF